MSIKDSALLLALVEKLNARGLSNREVTGAFERRFSIKVRFRRGKAYLGEIDAIHFRAEYPTIEKHFDAFLKSDSTHYAFCKAEKPKPPTRRANDWDRRRENENVNTSVETWKARNSSEQSRPQSRPSRVGSDSGMFYMAGAVVFGVLGVVFWPLLIFAGISLFLFFFSGVFNFDPIQDGKKVEGFGVLDGLPIGLAIPVVVIAILLFAFAMVK